MILSSSFPYTAEQTDWAVAGRIPLVFSLFRNGSYDSFLPYCWYSTCWPPLVVDAQKDMLCSKADVFQHFICDPIRPGAFFSFIFFSASSSSPRVKHSVIYGSKPALAVLEHSPYLGPDIFDFVNWGWSCALFFKNSGKDICCHLSCDSSICGLQCCSAPLWAVSI